MYLQLSTSYLASVYGLEQTSFTAQECGAACLPHGCDELSGERHRFERVERRESRCTLKTKVLG